LLLHFGLSNTANLVFPPGPQIHFLEVANAIGAFLQIVEKLF